MAVYAMEHRKHVVIEVPAADNLDECWQLVETAEKTRKQCQMMSISIRNSFQIFN
jgi:predicted dehydrogenase